MGDFEDAPSLDEMLDALGAFQRRRLLVALLDQDPQADSPFVVEELHSETDAVERLIQMRHVHLPKLEEYGFIEWDQRHDEVVEGPRLDEIRPLLEILVDYVEERPARCTH